MTGGMTCRMAGGMTGGMAGGMAGIVTSRMAGIDPFGSTPKKFLIGYRIRIDRQRGFKLMII